MIGSTRTRSRTVGATRSPKRCSRRGCPSGSGLEPVTGATWTDPPLSLKVGPKPRCPGLTRSRRIGFPNSRSLPHEGRGCVSATVRNAEDLTEATPLQTSVSSWSCAVSCRGRPRRQSGHERLAPGSPARLEALRATIYRIPSRAGVLVSRWRTSGVAAPGSPAVEPKVATRRRRRNYSLTVSPWRWATFQSPSSKRYTRVARRA